MEFSIGDKVTITCPDKFNSEIQKGCIGTIIGADAKKYQRYTISFLKPNGMYFTQVSPGNDIELYSPIEYDDTEVI